VSKNQDKLEFRDGKQKTATNCLVEYLLSKRDVIDIGSKILTGLASILLGIASLVVMWVQMNLQSHQLELAKIDSAPNIYLDETALFDDKQKKYTEDIMRVINSGGDLSKYSVLVRSFIEIDLYKSNQESKKFVPIMGYYFASSNTDDPSGVLSTHLGHLNRHHMSRINAQTLSQAFKDEFGYHEFTLRHVVKVRYVTKFGEQKVDLFYDGQPALSKGEVDNVISLLERHSKAEFPHGPLDIEKVSAGEIMQYISNKE